MRQTTLNKKGKVLVPQCFVAETFLPRLMGLMGKAGLAHDTAICFPKCNSIHTFFMRFPIDVVFLDKQGIVVGLIEGLKPWRLVLPKLKARYVIELDGRRAGSLGIAIGDVLQCDGVWS